MADELRVGMITERPGGGSCPMGQLNFTHDPSRRSWLASANARECDFPLQNLPFGVFRSKGEARGGVALGDCIVDLERLAVTELLSGPALEAANAARGDSLAPLLACPAVAVSALRARLSELFVEGAPVGRHRLEETLVRIADAELLLPLKPAAFTDFCTSIEHIRRMAGGQAPSLAAMSLPVAYNGRASSVVPSNTPIVRPRGQFETAPRSGRVRFGPEPMLDFELELGAWLCNGNRLGEPLEVVEAESLLFGCCLVNDWSARGIQFFESLLGPHLGKSFATTISPWIVTQEALWPFRVAPRGRDVEEPAIPVYLHDDNDRRRGAFDIQLTAELTSAAGVAATIVRTNARTLYWTFAQMIAHQASNGAPLERGDLVATGTVSGGGDESRACLAEATKLGSAPLELPDGELRAWLADGDTLTLKGQAQAPGFVSIGFGDCRGTIHPARGTA